MAPETALAPKPAGLTFARASMIPQAGAIALQGAAAAAAGRRILINGAGGGSGSFAIQLAKRLGADVTAVGLGVPAARAGPGTGENAVGGPRGRSPMF